MLSYVIECRSIAQTAVEIINRCMDRNKLSTCPEEGEQSGLDGRDKDDLCFYLFLKIKSILQTCSCYNKPFPL